MNECWLTHKSRHKTRAREDKSRQFLFQIKSMEFWLVIMNVMTPFWSIMPGAFEFLGIVLNKIIFKVEWHLISFSNAGNLEMQTHIWLTAMFKKINYWHRNKIETKIVLLDSICQDLTHVYRTEGKVVALCKRYIGLRYDITIYGHTLQLICWQRSRRSKRAVKLQKKISIVITHFPCL